MVSVLSIIGLIITLIIDHFAAKKFCGIAEEKGYSAKALNVYRWCFIFPAIGYAYVIALPYLKLQKQNEEIIDFLKNQSTQQQLNSHDEKLKNAIKLNKEDSDSWTCKKCGEKNPKTRMTCKKCDTYKNAHLEDL